MCGVPRERCACLVFLVILAVSGCAGLPMAVTDVAAPEGPRLRHQPPPPRPRRRRCPEHDASWKAYQADAVVLARVESKSSRCKDSCTVFFRVLETLKNASVPIDERFPIRFASDRTQTCDYDDSPNRAQFLVRTKIDQAKEYILFLDAHGPHNFSAAFVPEIKRKKTLNVIHKVVTPNFRPKSLKLESFPQKGGGRLKRLKLVCRVKGFPIPIIYWKLNNKLLHPNSRQRITQKKRKSTLVIRNLIEEDFGRYECVARGVDGVEASHTFPLISSRTEKPLAGEPCTEPMKSNYCDNGGTCFYIKSMQEYACECSDDYTGVKCEKKVSDQSRVPCTEPMKSNYCGNRGTCFYIKSLKEYACECGDDYTGLKCEEKVSDQSRF